MARHGLSHRRVRVGGLLVVLGLVIVLMGVMPAAMAAQVNFDTARVPAASFQAVPAGGTYDFTVGIRQNTYGGLVPRIADVVGGGFGLKNHATMGEAGLQGACGLTGGSPTASYILPGSWLSITSTPAGEPGLPYAIPARSNPIAAGDPYYSLGIRASPPPGATLGTYSTAVQVEVDQGNANQYFNLCVQVIEPPTGNIVVHKVTDPVGSGQPFTFDPSWGEDFTLKGGESRNSGELLAGLYSVAEIVPDGWSLDQAFCLGGNDVGNTEGFTGLAALFDGLVFQLGFPPESIRLAGGQTIDCWFYNAAHGRIIINKAVPAGAPAATFGDFWLAGGGSFDTGLIPAGVQSVSEVGLPAGWSLASAFCSDGSDPWAIGVSPGETVVCTFVNRFEAVGGSLTILKRTTPAGGAGFGFDGTLGAFSLDDGGMKVFEDLAAGSYTVSETPAEGWEFEDVTCFGPAGALVDFTADGSSVTVNLAEGEDVTCKFANREEGTIGPEGSLTILKVTSPAGGCRFRLRRRCPGCLHPGRRRVAGVHRSGGGSLCGVGDPSGGLGVRFRRLRRPGLCGRWGVGDGEPGGG